MKACSKVSNLDLMTELSKEQTMVPMRAPKMVQMTAEKSRWADWRELERALMTALTMERMTAWWS